MHTEIAPAAATTAQSKGIWALKLMVCAGYDLFDMTIGRLMFPVPFLGEAIGCAITCALFGKAGMFYGLEAIDVTEQIDGFIPTASIIALANKPR